MDQPELPNIILQQIGKLGLLERLDDNQRKTGVDNSQAIFEAVKDKRYSRVQGIGDDFIPDTECYNLVGALYSLFDKETKNKALRAVLKQLDGVNNHYIQMNHTPYIRDPALLADIWVARGGSYWPGVINQAYLWKGKHFSEFQKETMDENGLFKTDKVNSDFLTAVAVLSSDVTNYGEDYAKLANPSFLDRTLKGIVSIYFSHAVQQDVDDREKNLHTLLPKSVHDRIEPLRLEKDWADYSLFR